MSALPARRHYAAILLLSASILTLEIAVARVLSVALVSHYAFVAISLAMFGLGVSGLVVYLLPAHFAAVRPDRQLVRRVAAPAPRCVSPRSSSCASCRRSPGRAWPRSGSPIWCSPCRSSSAASACR